LHDKGEVNTTDPPGPVIAVCFFDNELPFPARIKWWDPESGRSKPCPGPIKWVAVFPVEMKGGNFRARV
jgi:hypothetical protein